MNKLLESLKEQNNITTTTNGDRAYKSTMNGLMDLFAFGGAYRGHADSDCVLLFEKAFEEDESLALRCLFYLRDVRGGQGERRFFRVVCKHLAKNHTEAIWRNMELIPEYGRWDDLYTFVDTPLEKEMFNIIEHQLALDIRCKTPSLLAKWLKSENSSSAETRELGRRTRIALDMTPKQYRKTLSTLRERIKVLERLMSQGLWEQIEFDKIPSKAGLIYRNAFAHRDVLREKYKAFAKSKTTKVNAEALNPCDVVKQALLCNSNNSTERLMINKYWDNLKDYFNNATFNGVAVVDTSGSMTSGAKNSINPIDVAIALGMYCAEKCNPNSPFYGNYISFSRNAKLIPVEGVDFVNKVRRIYNANLCENTDIENVFKLILKTAILNEIADKDMPENIVIISDMQFDTPGGSISYCSVQVPNKSSLEKWMQRYKICGYTLPKLILWNVNATKATIPMKDNGRVTYVSGYNPSLFDSILTGKTGMELILDKLNSSRYEPIH